MSMINEFVEKLIERLEAQPTEQFVGINGNHGLVSTVIDCCVECVNQLAEEYKDVPDTNVGKWIPVSEKLPENTDPVNITWVNHKPEPYYADIKDKPFTATGCYCDGKWYWYSAVCQAYLDEYRYSENDYMDNGIEVIAWQPLPQPYKGE